MRQQPQYRPKYKLIDLTWNARELDKFLRQEYGYGIFCFAHSLATIVYKTPSWGTWDLWYLKNLGIPYFEICKQEVQRVKSIRCELVKIIEKLDEHLNNLQFWDSLKRKLKHDFPESFISTEDVHEPLDREGLTKKNYKLEEIFKIINDEINYYQKRIRPFQRKRGRPVKANFILSAFWSLVMRDQRIIHWKNVTLLIEWIQKKLEVTRYFHEIERPRNIELIRRFRTNHMYVLEDEQKHFFKKYANPKNPIMLQINFKKDEPEFLGLSPSKCKNEPKSIIFPDGSAFP